MKLNLTKLTILFALLFLISTSVSAKHPIATTDGEWISIQSKNFFLVGNASESDIRDVATKLEQFRETFRLLFPKEKFTQTIGTNVVVFKDFNSYRPFLPKRSDGRIDVGIAGYFQPGEDVNYITLSTQSGSLTKIDNKEEIYETVFHEYVHFLLDTKFGRSEIPPWFNEGLAEYYQTFKIENDQTVYLGKLQNDYLFLLQRTQLIPLKKFFAIDNYSLHENGNHSRSIFYAQAWALIHYLKQTKQSENMDKFLEAVMSGVEQEKAFRDAFGLDYETMEKALEQYVKQKTFNISVAKFKNKLVFNESMTVAKLSRADVNAYLGDLLYHMNDDIEAEKYLQMALSIDANQSLANTTLGLVRMRQGKVEEAKTYLEKAIASNQNNHSIYYNYAYVLSRESLDEFGRVTGFPPETAKLMRKSLEKAISINPDFTRSYNLLAFINLVNNEQLDEGIKYLKKALSLEPGNQEYSLMIAQIYLRQEKLDEAEKIATKIVKTAVEPEMRLNAKEVLEGVRAFRENRAEIDKYNRESEEGKNTFEQQTNVKNKSELTAEEIKKIEFENRLISLNRSLKETKPGEKQIVGYTQRIQCLNGVIRYTIKTDEGTVLLRSKDFQGLDLFAIDQDATNVLVGCNAKLKSIKTIYTYRAGKNARLRTSGTLLRMTFVPKIFELKTVEELANSKYTRIVDDEEQRRQMYDAIKKDLPKLKPGEKSMLGYLQKIECVKNSMFFIVKTNGQDVRLQSKTSKETPFRSYSKEASMVNLGCGYRATPLKVIIIYRPSESTTDNTQGEIISMTFVPKDFTLE